MTINIYKQNCWKSRRGDGEVGGIHTLRMTGAQSWSGINLGVVKNAGEIISDKLMELHHALAQWASPKRNNNGRTRGTPTISVALGLVQIQLCQVSSRPKFKLVYFHRQYGDHKEVLHWAVIATVLESQQHTQCSTVYDWLTTSCDYVFVFTSGHWGDYFWFTCFIS